MSRWEAGKRVGRPVLGSRTMPATGTAALLSVPPMPTLALWPPPTKPQLKAPVAATADQKAKAKAKKPLKPGAAFGMARQ